MATPDAPPVDLPEKYEWAGYESHGTDLVKNLQAEHGEPEFEFIRKVGGRWRVMNAVPADRIAAARDQLVRYQEARHPVPTDDQLREIAKQSRTKRREKVSRKLTAERAAIAARKPPPKSRSGLAPTALSFDTTPPTTPRAGVATVAMPTPPAAHAPFVGAAAATVADPPDEKEEDPLATREAEARERIDASVRDGGTTRAKLVFRKAHGLPRPLKLGLEKAGASFVTDRYTAKPAGFVQRPKSSRLWRQNENEKAMARWRRMMGWGTEIGPTRKRIY